MRKKGWILVAVLCLTLYAAARYSDETLIARAKELSAEQAGERAGARELVSRGNIIYQDGGKKAGIYTTDFSLLCEKMSTVSGEIYDPSCYVHAERQEYRKRDITYSHQEEEEQRPERRPWTVMPEFGEVPEMSGGETAASEPGKSPETGVEETVMPEPEEVPEISVSGNDCVGNETEDGEEETVSENDI